MGKTSRTLNPALHMREVAKALKSKMRCRESKSDWGIIHTGTAQGVGWLGRALSHPLFRMVKYIFFYFGHPDLSLTTQTRFSNLTMLNTHKQRTDKLCLVAVANEFVALNDNRKGNFGTFRESDLKMSGWHSTVACVGFNFNVYSIKFWSNVGARL